MRSAAVESPKSRQLRATARQYKRDGYRVTFPTRGDSVPAFLGRLKPDLIAERENDRVVVEIKQADQVAGSNDIVALARQVEQQPGWRFEFISVPASVEVEADLKKSASEEQVDRLLAQGFERAAFLIGFAEAENLVTYAAVQNKIKATVDVLDMSSKLVSLGVFSSEILEGVRRATKVRNRLVHTMDGGSSDVVEIAALRSLTDKLREELLEQSAA